MKKNILKFLIVIFGIYFFLVLIFGIFGFLGKNYTTEELTKLESTRLSQSDEKIEITLKRGNNKEKLTLKEYLFGVVSAEMPASFENEALKAQAVAARTYTILKKDKRTDEHPEFDVCDDINHCKAYISETELKAKYGNEWIAEYYPKIKNAVTSTDGIIATYNGEAITAVFHSTSCGMTENSEDVWSKPLPYLVSVVSQGEAESPRYEDKVVFSKEDFKKSFPQSIFSEKTDEWIGEIKKNESGSVNTIIIGGKLYKGTEVRSILKLRSANFEIQITDVVTIHTKGNGHGVGMSQYGANYMAKNGYTYEQILKKYYTGIELEKIK